MIRAIFHRMVHNPVLGVSVGLIIGALTQLQTELILIIGVAAAILSFAAIVWDENHKRNARAQRSTSLRALREPDQDAALLASRHGHKEAVVGKVIEIWTHNSVDSMLPLCDLGIEPRRVQISSPEPRNFKHALDRCGGLKTFPPPNSRKYGIFKLPPATADDEDFRIDLYETDWNTYRSVRNVIESDGDLRRELSHVRPESSLIPQAMSLQFLIRFGDGDVLVMKRKDDIAYEEGAWSVSGEEQLQERDFNCPEVGVAEYWFRRAFIEEVFGNRTIDHNHLNRIWTEDCLPRVRSYRLLTFFLEENSGIFQPFGLFQLSIRAKELRSLHESAVNAGWGTTDPEGYWYVLPERGIGELLEQGSTLAHRLHGDSEPTIIRSAGLHSTSRYRLWRLYCALNRASESMTKLDLIS